MPAASLPSDVAAQPAMRTEDLKLLNSSSGKTAVFDVFVCFPRDEEYEYSWGNVTKKGHNFLCMLVDAKNPAAYCQGQFKKNKANTPKFQLALKGLKHGNRYIMKGVVMVEGNETRFLHSTVRQLVDLSKTTLELCVGGENSSIQPEPAATVAACSDVTGATNFDVTALVQEVLPTMPHQNNRSSFVVKIYDGSCDSKTNKVKTMPLRLYFDTSSTAGQSWRALLVQCQEKKKAATFISINGSRDNEDRFMFKSTKSTDIMQAAGAKADKLNNDAKLCNLQADETVTFEVQTTGGSRDWTQVHGQEAHCAFVARAAKGATGLQELDSQEVVWQINFVRIAEPGQGENLRSNDGTRLWMPLTLRDETGSVSLYITEAAVLKLTDLDTATEFDQCHAEGRLKFPFFCTVKIMRRPSPVKPDEPESRNNFDCFIVDAASQDMLQTPSARSTQLLSMLSESSDNILPARLDMLRKSDHYSLAVEYMTQEVPSKLTTAAVKTKQGVAVTRTCARTFLLVYSTKRSTAQESGANGLKLVTEGVVDDLPVKGQSQKTYTLISFCSTATVTDYKIDPPNRPNASGLKCQAALISVTGVIQAAVDGVDAVEQPAEFLVDDVQLVDEKDVGPIKLMLQKKFYQAALGGQMSLKRQRDPLTMEDLTPSPCKKLGRFPSGPEPMPDYNDGSVAGA